MFKQLLTKIKSKALLDQNNMEYALELQVILEEKIKIINELVKENKQLKLIEEENLEIINE